MKKTFSYKTFIEERFKLTSDIILSNKDKIIYESFFYNSPTNIYITDYEPYLNAKCFYVIKVGTSPIGDWAIYYSPNINDPLSISMYGDKIKNSEIVKKLVICSQDVLDMYRY